MENLEGNDAGTDNARALLTQTNLTAGVKKQQLTAEGGTVPHLKETRKDKMKGASPPRSCSGEKVTVSSVGNGMIGADVQTRSPGASKYT